MLASGVGYTDTLDDRLPRTMPAGSVNSNDLEPLRSSMPPVEFSCGKPSGWTSSVRPTLSRYEPARALSGAECSWIVAAQRELDAAGAAGGHFRTAQFPAHAVDHADGKLNHIAARDLKRDLGFDGERLHR